MNIDFITFPKVEHGYLLMPTPPESLKIDLDIYNRCSAVIYMAGNIGDESDKFAIDSKTINEAFVRAALSEFVGMEDCLKANYPNSDTSGLALYKSVNPIFHMLKLLRNYNIHLAASVLNKKHMKVKTLFKEAGEFDYEPLVISNLTISELKKLKSSKDYSDSTLDKMVAVFDDQQQEFGLTTLIIKQALEYAGDISHFLNGGMRL